MARGDIQFIKGDGASGRTATGKDHISGLLLYNDTLPSGFSSTDRIKKFYSIVDAENAGINTSAGDATGATCTVTVTANNDGDSYIVEFTSPIDGSVVELCRGQAVTDVPATTATEIKNAINAKTYLHGFTAANTTAAITVTAPKSYGASVNTITAISLGSSDVTATVTAFTGGAGSKLAVYHYHISEFFRANPSGLLYVGIFAVPSSDYTFTEITTMQNFANGDLRQLAVFKDAVYSNADLLTIHTEIVTNCDAKHKPLSALYAGNLKATADITTLPDVGAMNSYKSSSIIGQDGSGLGKSLYLSYGASITQLGYVLGMLSLSAVSEDFGQPIAKFNMSNGTENELPAFANGQLVRDLSDNALDNLDSSRHIFSQNYVGYSGTYLNDNHTAMVITSDYAYINDNRVIDKAIRGVYLALIPYLKGKLVKNTDGTLASSTVAYLENVALQPLVQMERDGDLSAVSPDDVTIDPSQNVNNGTLYINIKLNAIGIARNMIVPISFK